MARRKLDVVRPRITIPAAMWDRIENLAKKWEIDAPTLCRIMISQAVVTMEVQTNPELIALAAARVTQQLQQPAAAQSLMADFEETATYGLPSKREPEPKPEPEPESRQFGLRPRSELGDYSLLEEMLSYKV